MKRFTENIVSRVSGSSQAEVTKSRDGVTTTLYWEKSMNQLGSGYIYCLSWETKDGQLSWVERDGDYNVKSGTGMTCICDQFQNFEDELFVRLEVLEAEKEEILSVAEKIYANQK